MIAFVILATVTCTIVLLHALGTRWPWEQMTAPVQATHYHHIRFEVDEVTNGKTTKALALLERHGYAVVAECQAGWGRTTTITMRKRMNNGNSNHHRR